MKFLIIGSMCHYLAFQTIHFIQISAEAISEAEHTLMDYGIAGVFIIFLIVSVIALWRDNNKKNKIITDIHISYQEKIRELSEKFDDTIKSSNSIIMRFAESEAAQTKVLDRIDSHLDAISRK